MDKSKQEVINALFPMPKLLWKYYKIGLGDGNLTFHCPFPNHPLKDKSQGKDSRKSAKYFLDTNKVYCFREARHYSSYDIFRIHGVTDAELIKAVFKNGKDFISEDIEVADIISPEDFLHDISKRFMKGLCSVTEFDAPLKQYLKELMASLDTEEE
jgi:hypothetical protein